MGLSKLAAPTLTRRLSLNPNMSRHVQSGFQPHIFHCYIDVFKTSAKFSALRMFRGRGVSRDLFFKLDPATASLP